MKIRSDFVTNSSSSSFIVSINDLTIEQCIEILYHEDIAKGDAWRLVVDKDYMAGETVMDNFDMYNFMIGLGVDMDKVGWDDGLENPYDIIDRQVKTHEN